MYRRDPFITHAAAGVVSSSFSLLVAAFLFSLFFFKFSNDESHSRDARTSVPFMFIQNLSLSLSTYDYLFKICNGPLFDADKCVEWPRQEEQEQRTKLLSHK